MSDTHVEPSAGAERPEYLGHHYDTADQQFQSGKLGMWLFLATEVLLFSGLFCAYAIYRHHHPEVFLYAHHFLDTNMGALNTIVLIFSSFTVASAVRCAQTGKQKMLIANLVITLLCAGTFMGVKYVEYSHKWQHGLLWGTLYEDQSAHGADHGEPADHADPAEHAEDERAVTDDGSHEEADVAARVTTAKEAIAAAGGPPPQGEGLPEVSSIPRPPTETSGVLVPLEVTGGEVHTAPADAPANVHQFFGIYFLMTGLHGLHVLIGMIVMGWLIVRASRGHFGPRYFTPVDLGGLYWHLVDLIWIFLFPMLYLIH